MQKKMYKLNFNKKNFNKYSCTKMQEFKIISEKKDVKKKKKNFKEKLQWHSNDIN